MAVTLTAGERGAIGRPRGVPALRVSGLSVSYGTFEVLRAVDFTVAPGEVLGIAGENGAGKTTLVRSIAGDLEPRAGVIELFGEPVTYSPNGLPEDKLAVVWQDLALCDNLDVAANLLLGREGRFRLGSGAQLYARARALLDDLAIPLPDTTRRVSMLSGGQRQLLALARALRERPKMLVFDEPTSALGVGESAEVERLIAGLGEQGITVVLVSHDLEQLFRLADRVVVLRAGRVVGDIAPEAAHVDDVVALMSGQQLDSSPRGQLTRLHGLVEQLASSDRSSGLSLILSTLAAALDVGRLAIHVLDGAVLHCAASLGLSRSFLSAFSPLDWGLLGGPVGRAALGEAVYVEGPPLSWNDIPVGERGVDAATWSVPIVGTEGVSGVITLLRSSPGEPDRDEVDLVTLYAGYAAGALERERLFGEVTVRNDVLETIREVLETLAGPAPVDHAIVGALRALRVGLGVAEVALVMEHREELVVRGAVDVNGERPEASPELLAVAASILEDGTRDGVVRQLLEASGRYVAIAFSAPEGHSALIARSDDAKGRAEEHDLMSDASHSLRLALEREEAGLVHQEAAALRRSRELQRAFLSRLSHELRTPLTAIRGYASSLLQDDVTWDRDSEVRFLSRMASESDRLGRLVGDLLDFSAIESGVMRLQRDWCELPLILEAAAGLLTPSQLSSFTITVGAELPPIWADHDRLEQVFLNLFGNAFQHNPLGVTVHVRAELESASIVVVRVRDDGGGMAPGVAGAAFEPGRRVRASTSGTGLGLLIAKAIVDAHGGEIVLNSSDGGTEVVVSLPVEERGDEEVAEG